MQRPNVTNGCNDGMQCKMSSRCCRFAWLQKQKGFETQVPALLVLALLVLASATNGWNTGSCFQACSLEAGNYVWEIGHTAHLSGGQCTEDNEWTQYVGTVSSRHCPQRRQKKSSVHASYIRGGQCFENEERHHVFKALSNTEAEDILCVQRKQCQLLARHLDERIFHSNALKGVGIASVDGCNERSTMHSWHPEKKRRMPPPCLASKTDGLLDSAEGCKYTPQAADKQAFVLWAAYCLYLQPSAVEKARTLHLCPVGATADCESVHRSCPSCGSRIHSQQVSVLGQLLNGILWRRIPSRTPVSSGLRSTKAFFKWNITPTHPDPTDVILAIRRDTQGCCKLGCNDALGQKRRRHVELLWRKKQTFQAIKALTALPENIFVFSGKAVEVLIPWNRKPDKARWFAATTTNGCNDGMPQKICQCPQGIAHDGCRRYYLRSEETHKKFRLDLTIWTDATNWCNKLGWNEGSRNSPQWWTMHGDERILFGQSGFSALWNRGQKDHSDRTRW